jgi:N-acetylneuraminic acid mutarotase
MRNIFIVLLSVMLLCPAGGVAQKATSPWKMAPEMKIRRALHMMASTNGIVYVIGGTVPDGKNSGTLTSVEAFDRKKNTWSQKSPLPSALSKGGATLLGKNIYVIGGEDGNAQRTASTFVYDCGKDEWSEKASMRIPRSGHAVVSLHGKIYAIGGRESKEEISAKRKSALAVYTIEQYDTAGNEWTIKAQLPFKHFTLGAVVVHDRIFILSDSADGRMEGEYAILEEYDPVTNALSAKEKWIRPRRDIAIAADDNRFFVFGGWQNGASKSVDEYDLVFDQWTWKTPLPVPAYQQCAIPLDGKIYVTGGITAGSGKGKKTGMMIYTPGSDKFTEVVR